MSEGVRGRFNLFRYHSSYQLALTIMDGGQRVEVGETSERNHAFGPPCASPMRPNRVIRRLNSGHAPYPPCNEREYQSEEGEYEYY